MLKVEIKKRLGAFQLDTSFSSDSGVQGILGPSGCGKSLTLRCIAGIERPDSGYIELDGTVLFDSAKGINIPPQKRRVAYLFQGYALFPNMTVKENILCGLRAEKDTRLKQQIYSQALEMLQITDLENHRPGQLSGGQAQRVALARILVNRPKLLMLDEPFSALDNQLRDQLQTQMKHLLDGYNGQPILVTHNHNEAYCLCQNLALMNGGRILAQGDTKKLFSDPGSISGAEITGCRNIVAAKKSGEFEVDIPDWGCRLKTATPVGGNLCAIGIHSRYFSPDCTENLLLVQPTDIVEEPFELVAGFRCTGQSTASGDITWRTAKENMPTGMPAKLGIPPEHVLLLYPDKMS